MQIFELFRFQLLPISQQQQELFTKTYTVEEIREHKNEFLDSVLTKLPEFLHPRTEIRHKVERHEDELFIFKLSAHKSLSRYTEEFTLEQLETWPNVTVVINNTPDRQVIGISRNLLAFTSGHVVANMLERTLNRPLAEFGLTIQIQEQFAKNNFWEIIDKYRGRIKRVRFEMVSPNMANISHVLKVDLKQLNRESNSQRTSIQLEAVDGASLELSPNNPLIAGCVEYASAGGGDIATKVNGFKKEIRTSTSVTTVAIDSLEMELPKKDALAALNRILENATG
ncbi:MAG TPA: hypothetical protein VF663_11165 [Telluria sp.]|jgi:hypothetical protein